MKQTVRITGRLGLVFMALSFLAGCAAAPMTFDPDMAGPQLIVDPTTVRMGVATLVNDTNIVFQGKGFEPDDSVFIHILGVEKDGQHANVPIADAVVEADGQFTAEVERLVKITEFLRADIGLNDEMETYVILSRPPIPAGNYTVRAESMESNKKAQCRLLVQDPSFMDNFKDWIGGLIGKIETK